MRRIMFLLMLTAGFMMANMQINIIDTKEAEKLYKSGTALFLDARPMKLYKKYTIMGALNFPVSKYKDLKGLLPNDKNVSIITFCQGYKCKKSDKLAIKLQKDGYTNVRVYKGGCPQWKDKKLPTMGIQRPCNCDTSEYKPKNKSIVIQNTLIYPGNDEGMIDQFWFTNEIVNNEISKSIVLVDVRKKSQYLDGHIKGAINIPYDAKNDKMDKSKFPKNKLIVFYCNAGMMSLDAYNSLNGEDKKSVLYFDANINCNGKKCTIEPNEDL